MTFKLLLLLSLLGLVASVVLKKFLTKTVNANKIEAQLTTEALLPKISPYTVEYRNQKTVSIKNQQIQLPAHYANSKLIADHGTALLTIGLAILSKGNDTWRKRLQSMMTFDQIFLPFALIISIFGVIAKTIPTNIAFSVMAGALLLNCLNNFYLTWIRKLAIKLALDRLQTVQFYSKDEDKEVTQQFFKNLSYQHLIPNSLKWLS